MNFNFVYVSVLKRNAIKNGLHLKKKKKVGAVIFVTMHQQF